MILLDTHIWIWWVDGSSQLPDHFRWAIDESADGVAISAISCWEVAKKIEKESVKPPEVRTMVLSLAVDLWIAAAVKQPNLSVIALSPEISLRSTRLPGGYNTTNTDPGDQIIIATALEEDMVLMTMDRKIAPYSHVKIWGKD